MSKDIFWGWTFAIFSVLVLWGLNNVMIGYSAKVLNANYLVYTCSAFASCAFFLLLAGGKGPLVKETLRSADTWTFGVIMLLGYLLTLSLFSYVSSTEGSILQRISLIFSLFVSWLFFGRSMSKGQIVGAIIIFIGLVLVCYDLPEEHRGIIYVLMIFEGLALTGRMFVAEIHRPHKQAYSLSNDPRAKIRVVGFVMFIISTVFLSILFLLAFLQSLGSFPSQFSVLPTLEDFKHAPSIFAGLIAGVFLLAPLRLIEFSSAHLIKTENFLALAAFSSVATLFWEWITKPFTGLSLQTLDTLDIYALVAITVGGLLIAITKIEKSKEQKKTWKQYVKYETQDIALVADSKEIISDTMEFYQNDTAKVATALNIPEKAVIAISEDNEHVLAFKGKILQEMERLYKKNIALKDALTGLLNRAGFMKYLRTACGGSDQFHVLYIDLDKFKPVNDTHGHEAGDAVLQGVAERLNAYFYKGEPVARLGGDEYCVIQNSCTQEDLDMHIRLIVELLSEPFKIKGVKQEVCISASVGVASFPEDGIEPEELLHFADKGMYKDKENKNGS